MAKKRKSENKFRLTKEEQGLITAQFRQAAASDPNRAQAASREIAQALVEPLRQTLLDGNILDGIFTSLDFSDNARVEFNLDLLTPGQEREYYAYVVPGEGRIPERRVEADYLMVPTYMIGSSIDATLRFIRDANWPVVQRMVEVLESSFTKKINDDGWQTILMAATDRNIIINDPNAAVGQFTPRLISLLSTFMRRNGGGNSGTRNRARLTDLYVSPEALMDMRAWTLDLVPDQYRAAVFNQSDTNPDSMTLWGVNIHALDELGEGQDYQNYYTNTLNGVMANGGDVEIAVGLDLQREDSFVSPLREGLTIFEDNTVHRRGIFSLYGRMELGFAVLDSRRTLLASL